MLELAAQYKALAEFMKVEFFDAGSVFRPTPWTGSISPPRTMRIWELLSPERLWRYLPHTTPRASRLCLRILPIAKSLASKIGRDLGLVRTPVSRMGRLLLPGLFHGATMTEPAASVRKRRVFQLLHEGRFAGKSLMILVAAKRWTPIQAGKGITAAIQISIISECRYRWLHVLDLNLRRFWSV